MIKFIFDPKFFNCIILFLYFINSARWVIEKNFGQAVYWFGAFVITFAVTFLMEK